MSPVMLEISLHLDVQLKAHVTTENNKGAC